MVKINVVLISLLVITVGVMSGQGRGRAMDPGTNQMNIPGLTEKQKTTLTELATKHRAEMDVLRAERQGAKDYEAWTAAGKKMTEATDKHRFEIQNVLTDEQKKSISAPGGRNFGPGQPGGGRGGRGMGMMAPGCMGAGGFGGGRCWRR